MGWLNDAWQDRKVINFNNSGAGASGTVDVEYVIDPQWDAFWDAIDASGNELRVTQADGTTVANYNLTGFNKTNRTGTIQVDGSYATGFAVETVALFLYYNSSSTQGSGTTAVTITSAETGYIDFADPDSVADVYVFEKEKPGASEPEYQTAAPINVRHYVLIDITRALERRLEPSYGRRAYEEPFSVISTSEDDTGASASVAKVTYQGFLEAQTRRGRRMFLRTTIESMVDGTNYTIIPNMVTLIPGAAASPGYRGLETRYGIWGQDVGVSAP